MANDLIARISIPENHLEGMQIPLTFELLNQTDRDLFVLKWETPLEGLRSDCLIVTRGEERVAYDGIFVKRAFLTAEDFLFIAAGSSLSRDFDVATGYGLGTGGQINVAFDTRKLVVRDKPYKPGREAFITDMTPLLSSVAAAFVLADDDERLTRGERARQEFPLTPALVPGAPLPPNLIGFGGRSREAVVRAAHNNAYSMVCDSIAELSRPLAELQNYHKYRKWFGEITLSRLGDVLLHFTKIKTGMETFSFTYLGNGNDCGGSLAYTGHGSSEITVCEMFFHQPLNTGYDTQTGTIVHEHSHASANTTDDGGKDTIGARSDASNWPDQAINSAYCHEYYSEDNS
jgi:hypothetical protein